MLKQNCCDEELFFNTSHSYYRVIIRYLMLKISITIFSSKSTSVKKGMAYNHNDSKMTAVNIMVVEEKVHKLCLK